MAIIICVSGVRQLPNSGECNMTDYGTIKIPRADYDRHNERRKDMGLTWAEYLDGTAPQHDVPDADELGTVIATAICSDVEAAARDGARAAIEENVRRHE